ncbi:hypothetical protein FN846DRAFT_209902 [Sphaerosporella brunnea]|uniref:Uncharacterized protein n=1 Tax=Sphaerosporella brunnea TaxID=1250544 RepID=A0A5J5EN96_9PEZI|nr:hypothetical protein FN846DRAFT_209902 [Sphaerosporella brunnea]
MVLCRLRWQRRLGIATRRCVAIAGLHVFCIALPVPPARLWHVGCARLFALLGSRQARVGIRTVTSPETNQQGTIRLASGVHRCVPYVLPRFPTHGRPPVVPATEKSKPPC